MGSMISKQPWWQLLGIQAGGAICLPVIMTGQYICQMYGWEAAAASIFLGNLFLLILGFAYASICGGSSKSTVEFAQERFGIKGGYLFAFVMILSMMGWFGIQLNIITTIVQQLFQTYGMSLDFTLVNIAFGALLTGVMCFGMKALKSLALICAPLLAMTVCYSLYIVTPEETARTFSEFNWMQAISLVIGANIAAVIDLPTFFRHAKSVKDAQKCIILLYAIAVPLIEAAGVYLAYATQGSSLVESLQAGQSAWWAIWISCFVILSGWATNNSNLYSAIASSFVLMQEKSYALRALVLGSFGIGLACFNPLGNFEVMLDLFGIVIGGMGAMILAGSLWPKYSPAVAFFSWGLGVIWGLAATYFAFSLSGIPLLDTFGITFFVYFIQSRRFYAPVNV